MMAKTSARFTSSDDFEDDTEPGAADTARTQQGANCSDATKRKAYQEALLLKIGVESAAEVARGKLGSYRAYLKEAKKRGVDTKAITKALAVRFQDPDIVLIEIREELKMYDLAGFIPGIREKLLGRFDVQEATGAEEEENQVLIAYDKGVMSGRSGHRLDANPYPEGSLGARKWADGWRGGQRAIADEMADSVTDGMAGPTTTAPKTRRGKKADVPQADHPQGDLPAGIPLAVH
jgi:hypothetical protein